MATPKKPPMEKDEELIRLIALLLRRTANTQGEFVLELNRLGFGISRIAQLAGTTPNTVNQEIQKAKKAGKAKKGSNKNATTKAASA